jgi:hypothetical protein
MAVALGSCQPKPQVTAKPGRVLPGESSVCFAIEPVSGGGIRQWPATCTADGKSAKIAKRIRRNQEPGSGASTFLQSLKGANSPKFVKTCGPVVATQTSQL